MGLVRVILTEVYTKVASVKQYFFACVAIPLFAMLSLAQGGGKAEPKRIEFAAGAASARVVGTLRNGQEMEYVFFAAKGQFVTVKNATSARFDFRVFDEVNFSEGDFDSSPTYTFEVPETGDYSFTVRKKVAGPRSARFSLSIAIK